jgi:glycosyltransferase involved in cell wall biosynthesis
LSDKKDIKLYVGATKPEKPVKEKFKFFRIWTLEDFFPKKLHLYITGFKNQVFPFDPIAFVSLIQLVKKTRPDIIHIHKANKISFAPIIIGKLFKIPVVLAIYDYWYFCPGAMLIDKEANLCHRFHGPWCASCSATEKFGLAAQITSIYRRRLFDFFFSLIAGFLVLSEFNVKLLSEYGIPREKIFVVRQVYNPPKEKAESKIEKAKIYMNAWMAPHKGVHIMVQAFSQVVKEIPEARLYLETKVLDPNYEMKIKRMIKKLKLEDKVEIFERTTTGDYLKQIQAANVVVVAEQWENMAPTTLSDALSRGKAVVASRIGGLPEMVKDGESGLLADPHDPADFAIKIIRIIKDPLLAKKLGENAPRIIKKIGSSEKIKSQLLYLYQKIG